MVRAAPGAFDLVLLDPPFDSALLGPALDAAVRIVGAGGFVYVEAAAPIDAVGAESRGLSLWRSGRAGAVHFQLWRKAAPG